MEFAKKINFEEYRQAAFEGFLMECPPDVRRHILLCNKCHDSLEPMLKLMYDLLMNKQLGEMVVGINAEIIEHIKFYQKLNSSLDKSLK